MKVNKNLAILFFEDYFMCSLLPNSNNWVKLKIDAQEKIPLYFYVYDDKVQNDDFAKDRYKNGDVSAYGDFYDIILDESNKFVKYSVPLLCITLLNETLAKIKTEYRENITKYSPSSPYDPCVSNLLFIPPIHKESQSKITEYLKNEGFEINSTVNYYEAFLHEIQKRGLIPSKVKLIFVETYGGDMYFTYIDYNDKILTKKSAPPLKGKGIDHRIEKLAELMVKKAAKRKNSSIASDPERLANETKRFFETARNAEFDSYGDLEINIELSDFNKGRITITEEELQEETAAAAGFLEYQFRQFVSDNANMSLIDKIILNGSIFSNRSYIEFFEKFGKQKVMPPIENIEEILSRGVFELTSSSVNSESHLSPPMSQTPGVSSVPPLTQIPPLPKLKNSADRKTNNVKPPIPIPPPIPKPKNVVPPISQNTKNEINLSVKKPPPPPPPVPKLNSGTTEKKKVIIPPPPPLPKPKVDKDISKKDIK